MERRRGLNQTIIDFAGAQLLGARKNQEDAYSLQPSKDSDHLICLLADGMGGHEAGEVASELAVNTFVNGITVNGAPEQTSFMPLLDGANRAIANEVDKNPQLAGMGCTFVALEIIAETFSWISVGDSPLFLLRDGKISRKNADHSMAGRLDAAAAMGEISWEEAKQSPDRNALLSALTGDRISRLDVTKEPHTLREDDWLILASDGLETLDDDLIAKTIAGVASQHASDVVDALLQAVTNKAEPRQDNTTVIAAKLNRYDDEVEPDDVVTRPIRQ